MNECRLKRFSSGHIFNKGSKQQSYNVNLHKIWIHSLLTSRVNKLYTRYIVYSVHFKIALFSKISFTIWSTSNEFRFICLSIAFRDIPKRPKRQTASKFETGILKIVCFIGGFCYWTVKEWRAKRAQRNWKPSPSKRRFRVQKTTVLWNVFRKSEKPIKITFHHISRHFFWGSCEKVAWTAHASRE